MGATPAPLEEEEPDMVCECECVVGWDSLSLFSLSLFPSFSIYYYYSTERYE
jgi:hypothetical protein